MKIFIDTADLDEINLACSWGIVDGATTNPSLIKKAVDRLGTIPMEEYIQKILKTVPGPVSLEVIAINDSKMIEQARMLYQNFESYGDVVVKIPVNPSIDRATNHFDGLKTITQLSREGIHTNATLIMTPEQALLAAKAGANYVSPFAGRIDDYIREKLGMKRGVDFNKEEYFDPDKIKTIIKRKIADQEFSDSFSEINESLKETYDIGSDNGVYSGVDLVNKILTIYRNYGFRTEVIAASIRNARQIREVAELGVHIATIPLYVLEGMIHHYKTAQGVKNFTADIVPAYKTLFE